MLCGGKDPVPPGAGGALPLPKSGASSPYSFQLAQTPLSPGLAVQALTKPPSWWWSLSSTGTPTSVAWSTSEEQGNCDQEPLVTAVSTRSVAGYSPDGSGLGLGPPQQPLQIQ